MNKELGIIKRIFIPEGTGKDFYIDAMDSDKIGFIVSINDKEITVIEKQGDFNTQLFKGDKVYVKKYVDGSNSSYTIEPITGDF